MMPTGGEIHAVRQPGGREQVLAEKQGVFRRSALIFAVQRGLLNVVVVPAKHCGANGQPCDDNAPLASCCHRIFLQKIKGIR